MIKRYLSLIVFLVVILGGCSQSSSENDKSLEAKKETIQVYTTIFPIQDFSEKIGGKFVQVENIVPTGTEAHSFEPTTKTMIKIAEGDAFIYLGTGIEGFTDAVINAIKNEDTRIVKASEGISLIKSSEPSEEAGNAGDEEGDYDPHVWLDPERSIQLAKNIKNALVEIKPDQKEYFEENYNRLKEELEELDLSFKTMVENSPNNTFIVAHSAYGYWEDAYGLNQIGISGLSPSDEPSQKSLMEIIKIAETSNINYVLFEQNVENRVAEVIKEEIGADTLTLHNLESLNEEDIRNNEDYISIMKKNIETIKQVLK
ncbi:metal ABC transporter solute-binding protein, Zn/Mn family [Niallia oryzisoli]|uniref:metal ABC transporter solute-binding protein, Zn/Mn family n=1 Tax=Niallia oryzisoli TaxID=1737571 RepID=UPI0037370223